MHCHAGDQAGLNFVFLICCVLNSRRFLIDCRFALVSQLYLRGRFFVFFIEIGFGVCERGWQGALRC